MKIAVITGASHGLGLSIARYYKEQGFYIVAISRTEPPKDAFDDFIITDLLDEASRKKCVSQLQENYPEGLDVLVNNAGIGSYALWEELTMAELRRLFEIDFFAPVELTKALIADLAKKQGTIVNISSMASQIPVACMGAYCSVKSALRMFSESLRMETKGRGVHVLNVCPGRIDTGFSSRGVGGRRPPETPGRTSSCSDAFAKKVFRAYKKKRRELVYPFWYGIVASFVRVFPWVGEFGNRRVWKLTDEN